MSGGCATRRPAEVWDRWGARGVRNCGRKAASEPVSNPAPFFAAEPLWGVPGKSGRARPNRLGTAQIVSATIKCDASANSCQIPGLERPFPARGPNGPRPGIHAARARSLSRPPIDNAPTPPRRAQIHTMLLITPARLVALHCLVRVMHGQGKSTVKTTLIQARAASTVEATPDNVSPWWFNSATSNTKLCHVNMPGATNHKGSYFCSPPPPPPPPRQAARPFGQNLPRLPRTQPGWRSRRWRVSPALPCGPCRLLHSDCEP